MSQYEPIFFLSYARADARNDLIRKFFDDLACEVSSLLAKPKEEVGFYDEQNIELGDEWPVELKNALQCSGVMLSLYSPFYFKSEYCGKELGVFMGRAQQWQATSGHFPSVIFPLHWEYPEEVSNHLPKTLEDIQFSHETLGKEYAKQGLRILMQSYRREYSKFKVELARKIVTASRQHKLPKLKNFHSIKTAPNIFTKVNESDAEPHTTETETSGPGFAHFVFVAGTKSEMSKIRKECDLYGDPDSRKWRPFAPTDNDSVWSLSASISIKEKIDPDHIKISDHFIQQIRDAEDHHNIVVVIVDPWTIQLETYKNYMKKFDENSFLNCQTLIVWNKNDEESAINENQFQDIIRSALPRNFIPRTELTHSYANSTAEFQDKLQNAICEVRGKLFTLATVKRRVDNNPNIRMPLLDNTNGVTK